MKKSGTEPQNEADPTKFLDTYFRDRRIKRNIDLIEISECVLRAAEARESFKRMQKDLEPKQKGAGDSISKFSDAQKYNRRLLNNRKSAAAARVYREVLMKEQTHTLCTVGDERDRIAEEIKMSNMEIKCVAGEVKELRGMVRKIQAEEAQKRAIEQHYGCPQHEQKRLKALYCTFPHTLAPVLDAQEENSQLKIEMRPLQEKLRILPALRPGEDVGGIEENKQSLGIRFKTAEVLNLFK